MYKTRITYILLLLNICHCYGYGFHGWAAASFVTIKLRHVAARGHSAKLERQPRSQFFLRPISFSPWWNVSYFSANATLILYIAGSCCSAYKHGRHTKLTCSTYMHNMTCMWVYTVSGTHMHVQCTCFLHTPTHLTLSANHVRTCECSMHSM